LYLPDVEISDGMDISQDDHDGQNSNAKTFHDDTTTLRRPNFSFLHIHNTTYKHSLAEA